MGPGILPTRDFGDGHAVYEKAAMLGKRRMTPQRGAAQNAVAPEGTDLKTGKAYMNEVYTPTTTSGNRGPPIENDQRPHSKGTDPRTGGHRPKHREQPSGSSSASSSSPSTSNKVFNVLVYHEHGAHGGPWGRSA